MTARTLVRTEPDGRRRTMVVVAGLWSMALAGIGAKWTTSGGYIFGPDDPSAVLSPLGGVSSDIAAPAAMFVGVVGAVVALTILGGPRSQRGSPVLTAVAWLLAALLLLGVPDYRLLVIVAYTPLFLIGLPFEFIPVSNYLAAFTPPVVAQLFALLGGLVWSAVALGRTTLFRSRRRAASWGRWATVIAVAAPLVYAATRWAWALGIPLGLSDEMLRFGQETGLWIVGAGLATLAVFGALLTSGLALPWGERWPRWLPRIGGRPIPIALAVVPATVVAVLVTGAGLMFVRLTVTGRINEVFSPLRGIEGSWAALAPELLWPIWGPALAIAALAYARLRRPSPEADRARPPD